MAEPTPLHGQPPAITVIPEIDWGHQDPAVGHHDDEMARALARAYPEGIGDRVRFNYMKNQWHIWNGHRWAPDATRDRHDLVRDRLNDYLINTTTAEEIRHLSYLKDIRKQINVLDALSTMEPVKATGMEFDKQPTLIGVLNGVVDLTTGAFTKGHPDQLITMTTNVTYDPEAKCPLFLDFMSQITGGNEKLQEYLLLVLGSALFGHTEPQQFYVFIGGGSNGKGVLSNVVAHVFGDYAIAPSRTLYMRTRNGEAASSAARPDLLALMDKRFAHMSEPGGGYFNEELLKEHTGGDPIQARDIYGKSAEIRYIVPTHTIFFRTNDAPKLEDLGVSMRRRIRVVPFRQDFSERPDFDLERKLKAEAAGIFNLLVAHAVKYHWNPEAINDLPEDVRLASVAYLEDSDPASGFIRDCCVVRSGPVTLARDLYAAYQAWCSAQNDPDLIQMTPTKFGLNLGRRFRKVEGRHAAYAGIALVQEGGQTTADLA